MAKIGEGGSSRRKKRKLGDVVLKELAEKRVNLGNAGLTALWNQNPDNLEACRWALCVNGTYMVLFCFLETACIQRLICSEPETETSSPPCRTTLRRR